MVPCRDMRPGEVVAERFAIQHLAGTGGMGAVYKALDRLTGEVVALKTLTGASPDSRDRLAREGQALAQLRHPHVVRYVTHGATPQGEPFVAMDWVEGETLGRRLQREGLTARAGLLLGARLAEALAYAHERGVLHRDVKPGNVMLRGGAPADPVLVDFGVARLEAGYASLTQTGMMIGTPTYMAPEQARGARDVDRRADVFALGCLLFRCLAGRVPFEGEDALAVLAKVLLDDPPRLGTLRPDLPLEVDDLIHAMLAKERDDRPADAREIAARLAALAERAEDAGAPSRPRERITMTERRLLGLIAADTRLRLADDDESRAPASALLARVSAATRPFRAQCDVLASGSLVIALSGRPSATDLASDAARCALLLRDEVPGVAMVLVTGRAVMGGEGAGESRATTVGAAGDVFERATRLLRRHARGDGAPGVRVDDATRDLLDPRFDVAPAKGGPVLRGMRAAAEPIRTLLGKPTPCVGRERELRVLEATLDECVSEELSRAVLVTADAGMGKSRLRHEFLRRAREGHASLEVLLGRGDPLTSSSPYAILGQALRKAAGVRQGEPAVERAAKLAAFVGRDVRAEDRARVVAFVGEMVGVPAAGEPGAQVLAARRDPILMKDQTRRAFEDWLRAECIHHPVLIVLEDVHWADTSSMRLLDATMSVLPESPLMLLALARPEVDAQLPGLWQERGAQRLPLTPLSRKASEKLVREAIGDRVSAEACARIAAVAAGNAFYLEELIRAASGGEAGAVPESVRAMVQARLEALEPQARRVLRAASLFGETFWVGGVRALVGEAAARSEAPTMATGGARARTTGEIEAWLADLGERELVARRPEARFPDEQEYVFRHDIVREAAYGMLTEKDAGLGHRLAAEWLVGVGEGDALLVAEHFERGDQRELAAPWLAQAAEMALDSNDFALVLSTATRARACGADGEVLGRARLAESEAHRWRGETREAQLAAEDALAHLEEGTGRWVDAVAAVAFTSGYQGDTDTLERMAHVLLAHTRRVAEGAQRETIFALAQVARSVAVHGRPELGERLMRETDRLATPLMTSDPAVAARVHAARALEAISAGDHAGFLARVRDSRDQYAAAGDLRNEASQDTNVGYALGQLGRYEESETVLRARLAAAERAGFATTALHALQNLGFVLLRLGRMEEAERIQLEVIETAKQQGALRYVANGHASLSIIALALGQTDRAVEEGLAAVSATATDSPRHAYALTTLADALLARGETDEACRRAATAMDLVKRVGSFDIGEAYVRVVHAEALLAAGREEEAAAATREARDEVLRRANLVGEADRETFVRAVPENRRILRLATQLLAG